MRDARHAMHDILLLRISAILPEAISDEGLTPTTDTDLLLATYRGGSHLTSDISEGKITLLLLNLLKAKNKKVPHQRGETILFYYF